MKKIMLLALICTLYITGCEPEDTNNHTDTAFLVGTWNNTERGTNFTIESDLSFECELIVIEDQLAKVTGKLDTSNKDLGPNDYIIKNMVTAGDDEDYPANSVLKSQLPQFNNLLATLTPSADKKKFTFTASGTPAADMFFGGEYTKKD